MRRASLLAILLLLAQAAAVLAQGTLPAYQPQQKQSPFTFTGDALSRYEWTRDVPDGLGGFSSENRWRLQFRPRGVLRLGPVELGAGGEFNYSKDRNDRAPAGETLTIVRDNYRSRDARVDLAWAKLKLGPVSAEIGRFVMPIPLTEMVWDRDLRPRGAAASFAFGHSGSASRLAVTGLYAKGSHVFADRSEMFGGGAELQLASGPSSSVQLVGSYLQFRRLDRLDPVLFRQNTVEAIASTSENRIANAYRVVDVVGRLTSGGQVPMRLVADYCWNTALRSGNRGVWVSGTLGATELSRAQVEYTFARIDADATVAAFNTDDFFWGTGWEGHRADVATASGRDSSVHAIAEWQRFKDSPDQAARSRWVKRYRLEWRMSF